MNNSSDNLKTMASKKVDRIKFIDLAKGITIILVVIGHTGVNVDIPGIEVMRMPLYFILSGLFFKDYGGFFKFFIRKTNKILIPFLFFYITAYFLYYGLLLLKPSYLITDAKGIFDMFTQRQYFNGPIWFLLCLFWSNLIFSIIVLNIKNNLSRILLVSIIGLCGYLLGKANIFVPLFIDASFSSLPLFAFGYYLRKTPLLYPNNLDKWDPLIILLLFGISFFISYFFSFRMAFHYNIIEGGIVGYIAAVSSAIAVLLLSKTIGKVPIISYLGRYSIIVLGTHHIVYRPIKVILNQPTFSSINNVWVVSIITLIVCYFLITISLRYIPSFVAQKDLI